MPTYIKVQPDYRNHVDQYRIRTMNITDIPFVVQIDRTTWGKDSWPTETFFDILDDQFYDCWILENLSIDNSILGYGFQRLVNGVSHITNLCLHPSQRGHGLGGILLRHMIDYARRLQVPIVELEVDTSNVRAYTLYIKHGFQVIQLLQQYYSETADAYRMHLYVNKIDK